MRTDHSNPTATQQPQTGTQAEAAQKPARTAAEIMQALEARHGEARRRFEFGKIAYNKRKENAVTVDVRLTLHQTTDGHKYLSFAVSGEIWNRLRSDCLCGGQCLDTIADYIQDPQFKSIYRLWLLYHLNDMNAGTPEQSAAVDNWMKHNGNRYDYDKVCDMLKACNLYEVPFYGLSTSKKWNGEPYRYGTAWLVRDIPAADLNQIADLLNL